MHSACEKDLEGQEHKRCSGLNAFKTLLLHLITSVMVLRGGDLGYHIAISLHKTQEVN